MRILTMQRRMMELGRVRLGEKGSKGEPKRLDTFRLTSANPGLIEAAAKLWGGTARPWEGAPEEGYFEVTTEASALPIVLPPVFSSNDGSPTLPYSQAFELWSGGGCERRCDGVTESFTGKPCLCDPDPEKRTCKATTRVSFMLTDLPGLGLWRLESHGINAAIELPGTLELLSGLAEQGQYLQAILRIDHRTKKTPGEPTRRFIVPVIELDGVSVKELAGGTSRMLEAGSLANGPTPPPERPALPAASEAPAAEAFRQEVVEHGAPPPLPGEQPEPQAEPETNGSEPLSKSQFDLLIEEGSVPVETLREIGKPMFPGKSLSKLNDSERGQLWAAVTQVKA